MVGFNGLCDPLRYWEGFLEDFSNLREIKLFEAQGELREEDVIVVYASTLQPDTFL